MRPTSLEGLLDLAATEGREAVIAAYPRPVLLTLPISKSDEDTTNLIPLDSDYYPIGLDETSNEERIKGLAKMFLGFSAAPTPVMDSLIYSVERRGEDPFVDVVTLGRHPLRDIVLPDLSVSRLHAYFLQVKPGQFQVRDRASCNGTMHNGELLRPGQVNITLCSGDVLRFGEVNALFLEPEMLAALAQRILEDPGSSSGDLPAG